MKIDPYHQQQKRSATDSSFWQYKVYADIRASSPEKGRQTTQCGGRKRWFSVHAFGRYILGTFRDKVKVTIR